MKINGKINFTLLLAILAAATSCMTPKKVLYLQDMGDDSQIELENKFEAKISSYDELDIIVSCYDPELARPFNPYMNSGSGGYSGGNSSNTRAYLVDVNGNIQFPILGEIHVAGLTRLQLQEKIVGMLKDGGYIEDPFVQVRFYNFKIFFLGSDGGKAITINNERCTFLEALALSGDLNIYTKRDRIGVLREENGKMTMHYLDPRSSDIFNDPYYMLQQNDFIITEAIGSKYYLQEFQYWTSWLSLITSLASIATLVLTFTALNKP